MKDGDWIINIQMGLRFFTECKLLWEYQGLLGSFLAALQTNHLQLADNLLFVDDIKSYKGMTYNILYSCAYSLIKGISINAFSKLFFYLMVLS